MKLRQQILLTSSLIFVALLAMVIAGLMTFRVASMADNKARINQLFLSAYSVLSEFEKMAADGVLTDEQAKQLATRTLRNNIYKDNEYVYVADEHMMFVATPLDPQLHGTSFAEFKDAQGNSVGDILRRAVEKQPNGIAEYDWNSERDGKVVDLTSIARKTPRWGWFVGTGISYAEVDARFWSTAMRELAAGIGLAVVAIAMLVRSMRRLERMIGDEPASVRAFALKVAQGELHQSSSSFDSQSIRGVMQQMEQSLYQMVASCESAAHQLASVAKQADSSSSRVSNLVSSPQAETELVAAATHQLTTSAHSVLSSAKEAAQATDEANTEGQQGTSAATSEMQHSRGLSEQAVAQTLSTVQLLQKIAAELGTISDRNRAIALAASEQCTVGEDISKRIEKIAMFASDTRQQAQTSRTINQQLAGLSSQLEGLLQHFHLRGELCVGG